MVHVLWIGHKSCYCSFSWGWQPLSDWLTGRQGGVRCWGRLRDQLQDLLWLQLLTLHFSSIHLHISWGWLEDGWSARWTDVDRVQTHTRTSREEGSVLLHAHMLLWPRGSVSWGGQTDDTLSLCSSFLFHHPGSIGGYLHAHMHSRTHTTFTQTYTWELNQWSSNCVEAFHGYMWGIMGKM